MGILTEFCKTAWNSEQQRTSLVELYAGLVVKIRREKEYETKNMKSSGIENMDTKHLEYDKIPESRGYDVNQRAKICNGRTYQLSTSYLKQTG